MAGLAKIIVVIVTAFATDLKLVLGVHQVDKETNEINALPELLSLIDIKGSHDRFGDCFVGDFALGVRYPRHRAVSGDRGAL